MEKNTKSQYGFNVDERVPLISNHNVFSSSSDSSDEFLLASKADVQIKDHAESLASEGSAECDEATPLIRSSKVDFAIRSDGFSCVHNLYEEVQ